MKALQNFPHSLDIDLKEWYNNKVILQSKETESNYEKAPLYRWKQHP